MNFFFRNPNYCIKKPREAWETRKAMTKHREKFPICAWCEKDGRKLWIPTNHVHHIKSIWAHPELAADPENFITFCAKCHWVVGHAAHSWKWFVENVREIVAMAIVIRPIDYKYKPPYIKPQIDKVNVDELEKLINNVTLFVKSHQQGESDD